MMGRLLGNFKLLGILFLGLVVLSAWLTYAVFTKKFTTYEEVTLETSNVGLALPARADVKIRGVIVGEVLEASAGQTRDSGATLTLGLYPDLVDTIPQNVTASIVPKTLFGEKYVSLIVPDQPDGEHITAGDTITKTVVATEVEEVLNDLYPLLTTVQPADLNMTLNAVSTALEGRGDQLGENLETVDAYLKRLNPQIPELVEDLRLTAEVSDTYSDILPQVGTILENTITTTGTLEGREQQLNALFDDVASLSATTQTFLDENGDELVRLSDVSAQQLSTLARYAPEIPCLTQGLVNIGKRAAEAFRGFTLHIVLETIPRQPRRYTPADRPQLGEDRGANCVNLPSPPWTQSNPVKRQPDFQDGVDSPTGKGTQRVAPDYGDLRFSGSVSDNDVVRRMLAEGGSVDSDLGVMLAGPLMVEPGRGGER